MSYLSEKFKTLGLPTSDDKTIREYEKIENPKENPMPSKIQLGDYFENKDGWQRRYIRKIEGDSVYYTCYILVNYNSGNRYISKNGKLIDIPLSSGKWKDNGAGYCTRAHIRSWSQK